MTMTTTTNHRTIKAPSGSSNNTFPYVTVAAAAASSFVLGCLVSSSSTSSSSSSLLSKERLEQLWRKYNRTENYPIYIGSFWILVNRQHESIWQIASDMFVFSGLLYWQQQQQTNHSTTKSDDNANSKQQRPGDSMQTTQRSFSPTTQPSSSLQADGALLVPTTASGDSAFATAPSSSSGSSSSKQPTRYLELLVHNVSHTDLVLSAEPMIDASVMVDVADDSSTEEESYCLSRPRFSAFDEYSRRILEYIDQQQQKQNDDNTSNVKLISFPRYERAGGGGNDATRDKTKSYPIKPEPTKREKLPIGFALGSNDTTTLDDKNKDEEPLLAVTPKELSDLRFRGRDAPRVVGDRSIRLNAVFFPLLATLLPLWHSQMEEKYGSSYPTNTNTNQRNQHQNKKQQQQQNQQHGPQLKKVLILVSGVGSPRNWTHSSHGNSTYKCAKLMKRFLKSIYPDLIVVQVHSDTNIFRYDENITFVQQELMPTIQSYRDAHAKGLPYPDEIVSQESSSLSTQQDRPFSTEWRKTMNVTLSFADGSPARNHAIQAALRPYRPTYYHCWQLKTFWHESKIVDSDIEVHSFQEMETIPPIETNQLQDRPIVSQVVEEMKQFRNEVIRILSNKNNDIRKFWLRKTHKPVLAVLAVQQPNGSLKLYRGTNMEVSMPTGSLCAERNVIGSALADNPSLKRQDLKVIAVLSVPESQYVNTNNNGALSRSASTGSLGAIVDVDDTTTNPSLALPTRTASQQQKHASIPPAPSMTTKATMTAPAPASSIMSIFKSRSSEASKSSNNNKQQKDDGDWIFQDVTSALPFLSTPPVTSEMNPPNVPSFDLGTASPSTPGRRMALYANHMKHKRTIVVHSNEDLNPLRPCGACNEWLKKIAESNPYFEILTFTDSDMNGVYCTPCEE